MKKVSLFIVMLLFNSSLQVAQVGINNDGSAPDASAILDLATTEKGFLLPRMTQAEIGAISVPANGLQVYCVTDSKMYIYAATLGQWKEVAYGTGAISPPFSCGIPVTINHVAGNVAPVSKTVTYGTVTNIPGEPSKCWITSNLGADHQASAGDDATEASAGWYWQFNRMQGYKHDGTTRTPNSTWVIEIVEDSDWLPANDPCTLELGSGWRLPTVTEWTNVDASGGWTNGNGPWNSSLKMHQAGRLNIYGGFVEYRGYGGYYWSSSQYDIYSGWLLDFDSGGCNVGFYYERPYGFSGRCLRD